MISLYVERNIMPLQNTLFPPDHDSSSIPKPLLIGLSVVICLILVFVGYNLFKAFSSDSFEIHKGEVESADEFEESLIPEQITEIYVHVSGAVKNPGVYSLSESSRVHDAIELAGGITEEAVIDALNLARIIQDGEHIIVPDKTSIENQPDMLNEGDSVRQEGAKININTADQSTLQQLPGIGEATAMKIIAHRESNGIFKSPEDLKKVSGIGDKKYEALAELITV